MTTKRQEEYSKSIIKYKDTIRKATPDQHISHDWQEAIEEIIKGGTPTDKEFSLLTQDVRRFDQFKHPSDIGGRLWGAFRSVHYYYGGLKTTKHGAMLAEIAVEAHPEAESIMDVIRPYDYHGRILGNLFHADFRLTFPPQAARLLARAKAARLHVDEIFLDAYRDDISQDDMRNMIPLTPHALAWLVSNIGQSQMGDEYYGMALGLKDRWYPPLGGRYNHPVKMLLETLPEPYRAFTIKEAANIFDTSNRHYASAVMATKNAPDEIFNPSVAYLAKLKTYRPCLLRRPYAIPQHLCGAALCKTIVLLEKAVLNPQNTILGLPDEGSFISRTIESQFRGKHGAELFNQARAARAKLQDKLAGKTTYCETLLHSLKTISLRNAGNTMFARIHSQPHMDADHAMHLITCYTDILRCMPRLTDTDFDELRIGDPRLRWLSEPTEQEASCMLQILERIGMT